MLSASRKIKDDGNIIFMDEARTARESMDGPSMARLRDARDRPCYGLVGDQLFLTMRKALLNSLCSSSINIVEDQIRSNS